MFCACSHGERRCFIMPTDAADTKMPPFTLVRIYICHIFSNYDKNDQHFWHRPSGFYQPERLFLDWHFIKTKSSLNKSKSVRFKLQINISTCSHVGPAYTDGHHPVSITKRWCSHSPCRLGTLLWWELMLSFLFSPASFLPCVFLVISTGIGSNSSSATFSEPSATPKPEMRLLSSAA